LAAIRANEFGSVAPRAELYAVEDPGRREEADPHRLVRALVLSSSYTSVCACSLVSSSQLPVPALLALSALFARLAFEIEIVPPDAPIGVARLAMTLADTTVPERATAAIPIDPFDAMASCLAASPVTDSSTTCTVGPLVLFASSSVLLGSSPAPGALPDSMRAASTTRSRHSARCATDCSSAAKREQSWGSTISGAAVAKDTSAATRHAANPGRANLSCSVSNCLRASLMRLALRLPAACRLPAAPRVRRMSSGSATRAISAALASS